VVLSLKFCGEVLEFYDQIWLYPGFQVAAQRRELKGLCFNGIFIKW
jgi:hypothetical protein